MAQFRRLLPGCFFQSEYHQFLKAPPIQKVSLLATLTNTTTLRLIGEQITTMLRDKEREQHPYLQGQKTFCLRTPQILCMSALIPHSDLLKLTRSTSSALLATSELSLLSCSSAAIARLTEWKQLLVGKISQVRAEAFRARSSGASY